MSDTATLVRDTDEMAEVLNGCWAAFYKMAPSARSFTCANGYVWNAFAGTGQTTRFGTSGPQEIDGRPLSDGPPRPAQ